jgi:hypothetical protein
MFDVASQVVNTYCNGTSSQGSVAPFGNTIRVGRYKLIAGVPGQTTVLPWPEPSSSPVAFGLSNGSTELGTDHCRAGGVQQKAPPHVCNPWCLFDLESDMSESKDLASDPAFKDTVAQLAARVEEAAATGPPWAWPFGDALKQLETEMCTSAVKTGFIEPLREIAPPPEPNPPPPPGPPSPPSPPGPSVKYARGGSCLTVVVSSTPSSSVSHSEGPDGSSESFQHPMVAMGPCASPRAEWTHDA